jgi:Peptidase family M28/PDZ domain/PA domain
MLPQITKVGKLLDNKGAVMLLARFTQTTELCFPFMLCAGLLCSFAAAQDQLGNPEATEQLEQLQADIQFLASEELRGRSVEDPTIDDAAQYIANRMNTIGLDTSLFDGSPLQTLSIDIPAKAGPAANNRIAIDHDAQAFPRITASLAEGMNPLSIGSGAGQVVGPLVFAGYGISATNIGYDDYAGIDTTGAILIILRKEPGAANPSSPFEGTRNTRHAFFATKIENAIKHGAAGVVLVNDQSSIEQQVQEVQSSIEREQARKDSANKQLENLPAGAVNIREKLQETIRSIDSMIETLNQDLQQAQRGLLGVSQAGERGKDSVPVVSVARDLIDQALQATQNKTIADIEQEIDSTFKPQSFAIPNVQMTLRVELLAAKVQTSNVIGTLPGRGELASQTVVVGAHYDHVGMGGIGSLAPGTIEVHNGADDNASGTAAMLATAADLKRRLENSDNHRRTVFIAFTGEERGLLGSKYYARNPRFPLNTTVAMINLDMVGRLHDNELTVYGTGSGEGLDQLVEKANERQQFNLFKVASGYGPSDHQSFYEVGVPVLFFFTGLHNDYHRPSDDFDKIDLGGLTRITDTVSAVALELVINPQRPTHLQTDKSVQIRRQKNAFLGVSLSERDGGVVLSEVVSDGPAERAGLLSGDRLVKFGDKQVSQTTEVLDLIRDLSPGEELQVQVTRENEPLNLTIRLGARPGG